ncbi:MAG: DUF4412 domain-containing protein [bacterium]
MPITKKTIVTLVACAWSIQSFAGYQITVKSASDAAHHGKKGPDHSVVQMTTDSNKVRIDFKEGEAPGASNGSYLLSQDNGKTFIMVLPKDKTYMKWDMDSMMNMAGTMGNMMQMKVSDPKIEIVLDEAGPALLGYPTRHYKFHSSYRMSMSVMGFKNESSISKIEETWTTTQLDLAPFGIWAGKTPKTNNEGFDQLIRVEKSKMKGIPLKSLSIQSNADSQGKTNIVKSSMEVTEIKTVGSTAVSFEIPENYKEMSLPMSSGNDEGQPQEQTQPKKSPRFDFGGLMKKAMEQAQ